MNKIADKNKHVSLPVKLVASMPAKSSLVYTGTSRETVRKGSVSRRKPKRSTYSIKQLGYLGIEAKVHDTEYDKITVSTTVAGSEADPDNVLCLTSPAEGVGDVQRNGRQITVKRLEMNCHISKHGQSDVGWPAFMRVVVVQDKQTNQAQFNAEDVFLAPTDADLHALAMTNPSTALRFKILHDHLYDLNPQSAGGNGSSNDSAAQLKTFRINIPMNMVVNFATPLGEISDVVDNSIHVLAIRGLAGSDQCCFGYVARATFVG